jgi:hypothetical protein
MMNMSYKADPKRREYEISGLIMTTAVRLNRSVNGNPRFRITADNGTSLEQYTTGSDASVNYDVENYMSGDLKGKPVTVTFTRAGRIIGIRLDSENV